MGRLLRILSLVVLSAGCSEYTLYRPTPEPNVVAPAIVVEPEEFDFGDTLVGCEEALDVTITNVGNANLEVDQVDYYISYPADLSIDDYELQQGDLPWTIAPEEEITIEVYHNPTDVDTDYGMINVYSDDPVRPIVEVYQSGEGIYEDRYEETIEQEEVGIIDILFVIDNSCSMGRNQTNLTDNFDIFMNVFQVSGVDYQIGFVTTDSHDSQGVLISTTTVDPVTEVTQIIDDIGTTGSSTERGIYHAYEALQTGGDFGPGTDFWRNDSKLIVIFISDEDDTMGSVSTSDFKTYVVSVKGGSDYVTAHAVAGDYPGGCNGNGDAAEAYRYYTVVSNLNGTFLSICQEDWGTPLEILANESILLSSFPLTKEAVEGTIYIEVDGLEETEWIYDESTNSIYFNEDHVPDAGSLIYVSYIPVSDCF